MENIYNPPATRTVYPDKDHLRKEPDYTSITDIDRSKFFTTWDQLKVDVIRSNKYNKTN